MSRAKLREAILEAATRLAAERGLDALSMTEVRLAAGASNGSLFHFFPTKAALFAALYARALARYQEALAGAVERARTARGSVRRLVLAHVEWLTAHPAEGRILHEWRRTGLAPEPALEASNRAFAARLEASLTPYAAAGAMRSLPIDVLLAVTLGPAHAVARIGRSESARARLSEVAPLLADAAWAAVRAPRKRG